MSRIFPDSSPGLRGSPTPLINLKEKEVGHRKDGREHLRRNGSGRPTTQQVMWDTGQSFQYLQHLSPPSGGFLRLRSKPCRSSTFTASLRSVFFSSLVS